MKVDGTGGISISAAALGMEAGGGQTDPQVKELQNQIQNLQKQLKELSENGEMSVEMKSKKRQDLQKQISDLEMQLRQRQIEVKREEVMKKRQENYSMDEMLGTKQQAKKSGRQSTGMSAGGMEALISADASLKQADVHGSVAQAKEGKANVLESELSLDKMSGPAPAWKEDAVAELRAQSDAATAAQMGALAQAAEEAKKAADEDNSQEDQTGKKTDRVGEEKTDGAGQKEDETVRTGDPEKTSGEALEETSAEKKAETKGNTFDTAMLGVPFSRGYQTVDVKL